jgi:hypothetical protein
MSLIRSFVVSWDCHLASKEESHCSQRHAPHGRVECQPKVRIRVLEGAPMPFSRCSCWVTFAIILVGTVAFGEITYRASVLPPLNVEDSYAREIIADDVFGYSYSPIDDFAHAAIWRDSGPPVDLHPTGYESSEIWGAWEGTQVGTGYKRINNVRHQYALMWNGTAEGVVDLHPTGANASIARAVYGNSQVGTVGSSATLWHSSATDRVNLHPGGSYGSSHAFAVYEDTQVGFASRSTNPFGTHAMLWRGTAESFVNLHPQEYASSWAFDVFEDVQVGYGIVKQGFNPEHALLWRGSAQSVVDLHPAEYTSASAGSLAFGTNGKQQVGYASDNTFADNQAYVWSGSAESGVNLQPFLRGTGLGGSGALGISEDGVIVGYASYTSGDYRAIVWTPLLVGDYNADGAVDAADYTIWRDTRGHTGFNLPADGNRDDKIDDADYLVWKLHFGETFDYGGLLGEEFTSAIPEPRSVILSAFLAGVFLRRASKTRTGRLAGRFSGGANGRTYQLVGQAESQSC